MMEAASTSETSVNFYQTTRRNIPEDSHLHNRHRENLKSHQDFSGFSSFRQDTEVQSPQVVHFNASK
jgi:hypothetical protein